MPASKKKRSASVTKTSAVEYKGQRDDEGAVMTREENYKKRVTGASGKKEQYGNSEQFKKRARVAVGDKGMKLLDEKYSKENKVTVSASEVSKKKKTTKKKASTPKK